MMKITHLLLLCCPVFLQAQSELQGYRIAYNVPENSAAEDYEVYTMRPDGSDKKNITRHPDVAWTYYAYKDRLFWISDRDTCSRCYYLYESDAHGNGLKKVSGLRLEDSWMSARKRGRELIVTGRLGKEIRSQLFIINTRTGKYRQITNDTTARYNDPVFSPNGKRIVYRYKADKRNRNEPTELWIANADGSNPLQLTHYPAADTSAQWHSYHAGPPHWNAALGLITYQSKQGGKYRLLGVSPDGKQHLEIHDFGEGRGAGWHDWHPIGRYLAVELFPDENSPGDIYLFDYQTKELTRLTDASGFDQAPVWVKEQ